MAKRLRSRLTWGIFVLQGLVILATANSKLDWHRQEKTIDQLPHDRDVSEVCPRHYLTLETDVLECPSSQGVTLLPADYPPRTIFIGYAPEPSYLAFLGTLIESNTKRKRPLHIVVLIPRLDAEHAYADLKPFMQRPDSIHLTFLTMPSDETLWTQDYMEVGISMTDGKAEIIDLPYTDREGEFIPTSIALACQMDLVPQTNFRDQDEIPGSGDYGGNIEPLPGNLLLVGNTITQTTRHHLQAILTEMSFVEVNVKWLETGHVDELFTILPDLTPKAACPFALAYASPKLALELVQEYGIESERDRIMPEAVSLQDVNAELQDGEFFSDCLSAYAQSNPGSKRCRRLIDANVHYDALIEQARRRIDALLVKRNVCANPNWIALPQLFVPSFPVWLRGSAWGTEADRAQALNPNTVNMVALGEDLIVPQQPYLPFEHDVMRRLKPLGLSLIRADTAFSHFLNGGLHCNTSVVRMCRKKS